MGLRLVPWENEKLWRSRVLFALALTSWWGGRGCWRREKRSGALEAQNSILQAGKDSSCMTTVLLEARTMMFRSCCLSCVCWYHSRVTSVSWVGIRVTWQRCNKRKMRGGRKGVGQIDLEGDSGFRICTDPMASVLTNCLNSSLQTILQTDLPARDVLYCQCWSYLPQGHWL